MFVAPSFGVVLTKQPHEFTRRDEYNNIKQQTVWRCPGMLPTRAATPSKDIQDDTGLAKKIEHPAATLTSKHVGSEKRPSMLWSAVGGRQKNRDLNIEGGASQQDRHDTPEPLVF